MIDVNQIPRKGKATKETDLLAGRVDIELSQWVKSYCKIKGFTVSKLLGALVRDFKSETEAKEDGIKAG